MQRSAVISECLRYRYILQRTWDSKASMIMFVGLNPSTADGQQDDPTVRRCIAFAKAWGVKGAWGGRDIYVKQMLPQLHYLRLTKAGYPQHPLYLPKKLQPLLWEPSLSRNPQSHG